MKTTYKELNTAGITQILELAILRDLRKNPKSTTFEVATATGCPLNTAYSTLRRLSDLSLVEQRNSRPTASEWILTPKAKQLLT
jgi:DNA-binding IclR family transcriptional regulator